MLLTLGFESKGSYIHWSSFGSLYYHLCWSGYFSTLPCGVSNLLPFNKVTNCPDQACTIITYCIVDNRELRTSIHGQILINLSLALMGVYIFFLIGGHVTSITILCGVSSALLHYFLLVFFGWTAVEAVWLYIKLVKVFGIQSITSKFTLKAGIPTWGETELNTNNSYGNLIKVYV